MFKLSSIGIKITDISISIASKHFLISIHVHTSFAFKALPNLHICMQTPIEDRVYKQSHEVYLRIPSNPHPSACHFYPYSYYRCCCILYWSILLYTRLSRNMWLDQYSNRVYLSVSYKGNHSLSWDYSETSTKDG